MSVVTSFIKPANNLPDELLCLSIKDLFLLPSLEQALTIVTPSDIRKIDKSLANPGRFIATIPYFGVNEQSDIGCIAKITTFIELEDSKKYIVGLTGMSRFNLLDSNIKVNSVNKIDVSQRDSFFDDRDFFKQKIFNRDDFNKLLIQYLELRSHKHDRNFTAQDVCSLPDAKLLSIVISKLSDNEDFKKMIIDVKNISRIVRCLTDELHLAIAQDESVSHLKH
jgi:Lon protease-like protein